MWTLLFNYLCKTSAVPETMSGPIVDSIISAVQSMFSRGAPNEWDYSGFNKIHYSDPKLLSLQSYPLGSEVPIPLLIHAINVLMVYSKTQLPEAIQLKKEFEQAYYSLVNNQVDQSYHQEDTDVTSVSDPQTIPIRVLGPGKWGKTRILVPGHSISAIALKRAMEPKAQELGIEHWKGANLSKNEPSVIEVRPEFYDNFVSLINTWNEKAKEHNRKAKKWNASLSKRPDRKPRAYMNYYDISPLTEYVSGDDQPKDTDQKIAKIVGDGSYGRKRVIIDPPLVGKLYYQVQDIARQVAKDLGWKEVPQKYGKRDIDYDIWKLMRGSNGNYEFHTKMLRPLKEFLALHGYDVSGIDTEETTKDLTNTYKIPLLAVEPTDPIYDIGLRFINKKKYGKEAADSFKEIVKFSFPIFSLKPDNNSNRWIDTNKWVYNVKGNYSEHLDFIRVAENSGFDTSQYKRLLENKIKEGRIIITRVDGELDGFSSKDEFKDAIQETLVEGVSLYKAQEEGVEFLYSRSSAFLGDETGAGKCISPETKIYINNEVYEIQDAWNYFVKDIVPGDPGEEWGYANRELFTYSVDENGKVCIGKIQKFFRQKFKGKLRRITTSSGRTILTTFQHKFLTPHGWSNSLDVGDIITSSCNMPRINVNSHKSKSINKDLIKFLAWQISEGCELSKDRNGRDTCSITQKEIGVLDDLKETFDRNISPLFKSYSHTIPTCTIYKKNKYNRCPYIRINSTPYRKYLESIGYTWGSKSRQKIIPAFIMQASDVNVKVFLKYFFDAEAHVCHNKKYIEVTLASEFLIYQLSTLLSRFNILHTRSTVYKSATNGSRITKPYYRLKVIGSGFVTFMDKIGFDYKYKQATDATIINPNKEGKPLHLILQPFFDKYQIPHRLVNIPKTGYIHGGTFASTKTINRIIDGFQKLRNGRTLQEYNSLKKSKWTKQTIAALHSVKIRDIDEVIHNLTILRDNDLIYEKITSVKEVYFDGYIYDLSIDKYHNYIAENLVTHNTAQAIVAAILRSRTSSGKTLVITIPATQIQWKNEVLSFTGNKVKVYAPTSGASFDPEEAQQADFTILYYHMFSAPKTGPLLLEALKTIKWSVLIEDECHYLKNESTRTKRILELSQQIPFKWGLSATISANYPIDIWRQLKAIGHRLGNLSEGQFRREFAGQEYIRSVWGGEWVPISDEAEMQAVIKLRKWLTEKSGIYIRRSKKDIRPDLPSHIVVDNPIHLNEQEIQEFNNAVAKQLSTYKDPDLAISEMIAERAQIALAKVPYTLSMIENTLSQPDEIDVITKEVKFYRRALVFTCFQEVADQLKDGAEKIIQKLGKNGTAVIIDGRTPPRMRKPIIDNFRRQGNLEQPVRVVILSIQAGGTGLDVPNVVNEVIMNDYSWTPKDAEQAEGRAFRINSQFDITTKYVIAANTVDEKFWDIVQKKRKLAAEIDKATDFKVLKNLHQELDKLNAQINKVVNDLVKLPRNKQSSWLQRIGYKYG